MIRLHCTGCGKKLKCPDGYAGLTAKCPHCKYENDIPKLGTPKLEKMQVEAVEDNKYLNAFCGQCGNKISKYADICPKCGCKNTLNQIKEERENRNMLRQYGEGNVYVKQQEKKEVGVGTIVCAYLLALFMPIVGFIMGIVIICRGAVGHGVLAIIISLIAWWSWAVLFF